MLLDEDLRKQKSKRSNQKLPSSTLENVLQSEENFGLVNNLRSERRTDNGYPRVSEHLSAQKTSCERSKIRHDNDIVTVLSTNQFSSTASNFKHRRAQSLESATSPRESIELKVYNEGLLSPYEFGDEGADSSRSAMIIPSKTENDGFCFGQEDVDPRSMHMIASDADLPWLDVGVKVGKLLLNSAHVQRAMTSQETTERLLGIGANFGAGLELTDSSSVVHGGKVKSDTGTLISTQDSWGTSHNDSARADNEAVAKLISKPVHPIWTSPSAAGSAFSNEIYSLDDTMNTVELAVSPSNHLLPAENWPISNFELPPLSPSRCKTLPKNPVSQMPNSVTSPPVSSSPGHALIMTDSTESTIEVSLLGKGVSSSKFEPDPVQRTMRIVGLAQVPVQVLSNKSRSAEETTRCKQRFRRMPLKPGVKVAVPLCPGHPNAKWTSKRGAYVMGSVVSSKRIFVPSTNIVSSHIPETKTNCLSVTTKMESFFLRNGEFAELTFRVMDDFSPRYMPRHSKVPVGSCVATSFGIGVLVGWRVEDDCHVVRSLWQRRGAGSAHAYLNRHAIHGTIEAAVGFDVETAFGSGVVLGCVGSNSGWDNCQFIIAYNGDQQNEKVLKVGKRDIVSCNGAQFIPIIELLREAAKYQIQIDSYHAAVRGQRQLNELEPPPEHVFLMKWTIWAEIIWSSFLRAVEEDTDFDSSVNDLINSILDFLEKLDKPPGDEESKIDQGKFINQVCPEDPQVLKNISQVPEPGFWIMDDLLGGIFTAKPANECPSTNQKSPKESQEEQVIKKPGESKFYERAYGVLRIAMKTVSIARASSADHPHLRLALAIGYDFLLFIRTVLKVQQQNDSMQSLDDLKRAWNEIVTTFGPIKDRLARIGHGIAHRMQAQGRKAKIRVLKFAEIILGDDLLLVALEQGEWDRCMARLEIALIEASVIGMENMGYYRKAAKFLYGQIQVLFRNQGSAASRNSEKLAFLAKFIQAMATPRRSILKFICRDEILELFERILIRTYKREEIATRMLTIHAANFHTGRHLRMLKYFPIAGRIWIPLLDAADEEFSWLVSMLPENSQEFLSPLSSLFSLCVVQFHKINEGDLSRDWLAFLLEEDAARIIQDLDYNLLLALESFSRDIRDMIVVLPYYSRIDDDILNLIDEVNIDEFLREASDALDDPDLLGEFIREKATSAIERFLNYLPKLSIPVEKRELGDGWVLTCRGEDGGHLTLSDVFIKRENLSLQVMGGDALFFPLFHDEDGDSLSVDPLTSAEEDVHGYCEESVLDQIRELIINAQKHGCWRPGVGGVDKPSADPFVSRALHGLPLSMVLNCAIDLWRNLELDDDELLEVAIRDVSYQIQLDKEREEGLDPPDFVSQTQSLGSWAADIPSAPSFGSSYAKLRGSGSSAGPRHRFNPRIDPTVLYLEIKSLNLNLENFLFRIEKSERTTIFDPVFEGRGTVSLQDISIRLRIECAKERVSEAGTNTDVFTPILQLQELEVKLQELRMKVKDTGFGSDWILNKAVDVFQDQITAVVEENLKEQVNAQVQIALENLNSYFLANPSILLNVLGISMEDLDDNVVWV